MFNLSTKKAADRPILKFDYFRYIQPSLNLVSGGSNQIFIDILRKDVAISMKDRYLDLNFNVTHGADGHGRFVDDDHIRLVNLGPMASFIKYRLTSPSGKEKEKINQSPRFLFLVQINIKKRI